MAPTTTSFVLFLGFEGRQSPTGISSASPYLNKAMMYLLIYHKLWRHLEYHNGCWEATLRRLCQDETDLDHCAEPWCAPANCVSTVTSSNSNHNHTKLYFGWTSQVLLPFAIQTLQAAGYKLVTLAECLGKPAYQSVAAPKTRDVRLSCIQYPFLWGADWYINCSLGNLDLYWQVRIVRRRIVGMYITQLAT